MPDPEFYVQCIQDSFDELKTAASDQAAGGAEKSSKGKIPTGTKKSSKDKTIADESKTAASVQESGSAGKSSKGKSSSGRTSASSATKQDMPVHRIDKKA